MEKNLGFRENVESNGFADRTLRIGINWDKDCCAYCARRCEEQGVSPNND